MKYSNPIIRGFNPDPSICRSGRFYYLVTSTFEFYPGAPVYRSTNLVDWELISYALTRENGFKLGNCWSSGGLYAPTIRYHEGTYYIVTTNVSGEGHIIVHAKNPRGPWSKPVKVELPGIDPSITFADDTVYFTCTGRTPDENDCIVMTEINPVTGEILKEPVIISTGMSGKNPEGPHLYKIKDKYYLMLAEGGTEFGHMETIFRSDSPYGPYEGDPHNPIIRQRDNTHSSIRACGHADMVEDRRGRWWMVNLGVRNLTEPFVLLHNLGRETMLSSVVWTDEGWPVVGEDGFIFEEMEGELPGEEPVGPQNEFTDDFKDEKLNLNYGYLRDPEPENYELTPGGLLLHGSLVTLNDIASPTFIGLRQTEHCTKFKVNLRKISVEVGGRAGITAFYNESYHFEIYIGRDANGVYIGAARHIHDLFVEVYHENISPLVSSDVVRFIISADQTFYHASYKINGGKKREIARASTAGFCTEGTMSMTFTGTWLGMFAEKGDACFCDLSMTNKKS